MKYAQTKIQLFSQLLKSNYSQEDLELVLKAYGMAVKLYTCRYQYDGKIFLAHGIGMASILCAEAMSSELIASALIHNIYRNGNFGNAGKGLNASNRKLVRDTLGDKVEQYVYIFSQLPLQVLEEVVKCYNNLDVYDSIQKSVILLFISDFFEKCLDAGMIYKNLREDEKDVMIQKSYLYPSIAIKLGYSTLAENLVKEFKQNKIKDISPELKNLKGSGISYIVVPLTLRKKIYIVIYRYVIEKAKHLIHRTHIKLYRLKKFLKKGLLHLFRFCNS